MRLPLSLNFRDLGGIPLADGSGMVPQRLYMRSGKLSVLTPRQCQAMCRYYNIGCVIDLRTSTEASEYPDPLPPTVRYVSAPLVCDALVGITRETGSDPMTILKRLRHQPEKLRAMMPDFPSLYHQMVRDAECQQQIRLVVDTIRQNASQGVGTLFHCTAGKDRTGIISLALLRTLGVDDAHIRRDYLLTNRSAFLPTIRKCLGIWLFTRNMPLVRFAYHAFMADASLLQIAMDELPRF